MVNLNVKVRDFDDDTLFSQKKVKIGSKSVETPVKALEIGKTTNKDEVSEVARGINEIYFEISPSTLNQGRSEGNANFKQNVNRSVNKTENSEINIVFARVETTNRLNEKNMMYMMDFLYSTSDFIVVPLMPDLLDKIKEEGKGLGSSHFDRYMHNINIFLELADSINNKPIMGTIPALPWDFTDTIVSNYIDSGVRCFCFNFNGRVVTANAQVSEMVMPLMRRISTEDLQEEVFMYALNAHRGRKTGGGIKPARDMASLGFGFDILGNKHVSPSLPPHIYEKIKNSDPEIDLFDPREFSYQSYGYNKRLERLISQRSALDPHRVISNPDKKWRYNKLLNAEEQSREAENLRTAISEERVVDYLTQKRGVERMNLMSDLQEARGIFEGGKKQSRLSELDDVLGN